jgi:hypothetical protein
VISVMLALNLWDITVTCLFLLTTHSCDLEKSVYKVYIFSKIINLGRISVFLDNIVKTTVLLAWTLKYMWWLKAKGWWVLLHFSWVSCLEVVKYLLRLKYYLGNIVRSVSSAKSGIYASTKKNWLDFNLTTFIDDVTILKHYCWYFNL